MLFSNKFAIILLIKTIKETDIIQFVVYMAKLKKSKFVSLIIFTVIVVLLFLSYINIPSLKTTVNSFLENIGIIEESSNIDSSTSAGEINVHFIDVGQGDSILVTTPDGNMLIDAGPTKNASNLEAYLKNVGVEDFEYVVFTHPHEDHIGGAVIIMNDFNVKNVIMPNCVQTTKVFENMITAIENSGATVHASNVGDEYSIGELKIKILAPIDKEYENINNYSVVLRIDYKETSFMMTGDAEELSEREILSEFSTDELTCNVLKIGHHGSESSTSNDFLSAVNPEFAIISCGEGNQYGHPDRVIIEKLENAGITYYRTDECQTIVFISNGETVRKK